MSIHSTKSEAQRRNRAEGHGCAVLVLGTISSMTAIASNYSRRSQESERERDDQSGLTLRSPAPGAPGGVRGGGNELAARIYSTPERSDLGLFRELGMEQDGVRIMHRTAEHADVA